MSTVSLRIPDELDERLNQEARRENRPRSELLREALIEYLERKEKERCLSDFVAEARTGYGHPEVARDARTIAEDFLELENEALNNADEKWWK
jgi:predicted transcriptional regulator